MGCVQGVCDVGEVLALSWESRELRRLGSVLSTYIKNQAVGQGGRAGG